MSKDYAQVITKINQSLWLITPESLSVILEIVDNRIKNGKLDSEEYDARMAYMSTRGNTSEDAQTSNVVGGLGIVPLTGPIFGKANLMTMMSGATSLEQFKQDFEAMVSNEMVHSILMDVDSPGGTSDLVQEVGDVIYEARDVKPVYALANTMSGSAAFWLMSQATEAYCTPSGSVGSIGVYTVHEDQSVADAKQGNRFTYISAGPHKTEGNPHQPLSEEAREYKQSVVNDLYDEFVDTVGRGREMTSDDVLNNFGGGRMLPANKALDAGMIDGITTYDNLVSNLTANRPRQVQVAFGNGIQPIAATMVNGTLYFGDTAATSTAHVYATGGNADYSLEVAEYEHSEPGSGSPPIPRPEESDRSGDKDNKGIRRDTPPIVREREQQQEQVQAMHRREDNVMKLSNEVLTALGLSTDASDEQVEATVMSMVTELGSSKAEQLRDKSFAEQYPEQHSRMLELESSENARKAVTFAEQHKWFTEGTGDDVKQTSQGLSALALETIAEAYTSIGAGDSDALEMFSKSLTTVMSSGSKVEYGETGSSRASRDGFHDGHGEVITAADSKSAAKQLANIAHRIQNDAGGPRSMSWGDALAAAQTEQPELAKQYMQHVNNNRG